MRLRSGCEFIYEATGAVPTILLVSPHAGATHTVVEERWASTPPLVGQDYHDLYGNRPRRLVIGDGTSTLRYEATIEVSGEPDILAPNARQLPVEELPHEILFYTLASRYCLSDALSAVAWKLFGNTEPGWARVQAVCDWINTNISYGLHSTPLTNSADIYVAGGGMCRDFAHLAITFCRALSIPARYVFGYMPDTSFVPPYPTMDFHAWFEVYLADGDEGRWWTFDARFNRPMIGRVPIGIGRDAVDVPMVTTYGPASFKRMTVWCDEIDKVAE
jgi:transglutaminase-like putative cysteine protease